MNTLNILYKNYLTGFYDTKPLNNEIKKDLELIKKHDKYLDYVNSKKVGEKTMSLFSYIAIRTSLKINKII